MYGKPSCPMVLPMRGLLERSKAAYRYIDISQNDEARQFVSQLNDGYESVPTFIFPDQSTLTEPSSQQMNLKLKELGYTIPLSGHVSANMWLIIVVALMVFALLRFVELI